MKNIVNIFVNIFMVVFLLVKDYFAVSDVIQLIVCVLFFLYSVILCISVIRKNLTKKQSNNTADGSVSLDEK